MPQIQAKCSTFHPVVEATHEETDMNEGAEEMAPSAKRSSEEDNIRLKFGANDFFTPRNESLLDPSAS